MILDLNRSKDLRGLLISGATYIHPVFLSIVLARASIFQQSNIFFERLLCCAKTWVVVKRGRQEKLLGNVTRIPTCLLQREKSSYCTFLQLGQMFNGLRKAHTTQHPLSVHPAFFYVTRNIIWFSNSKIISIAIFPDASSDVLGVTTHLETHWYFLKMASEIFGTLFSMVSVSIKSCWSSSAIVREESEFSW